MARQTHLKIIRQGVDTWNNWRQAHPEITRPNLNNVSFNGAQLVGVNFHNVQLTRANFLVANLSGADLSGADITESNFYSAKLAGAKLAGANLTGSNFGVANLVGANLTGASLSCANLVGANLTGANLTGCTVYGISVWDVQLDGAAQADLKITRFNEPDITVDNLKIAQFIHLLLNNREIRDAIETIAKKAALILGRFTPERKAILDTLRETLRTHGYLPILFDFEKPSSRNFTETVRTLAHLSRFIIADLTDPSSIPQELQAIVPTLRVPVQPVLLEGKREYAMFVDFLEGYHWVLPIHYYRNLADLLATLKEHVIEPAERKARELEKR